MVGFAAFLGSGAPSAGAVDAFPGNGFLPDNRAWELASPADKLGSDVMADSMRTRAASVESPGLPMAASFSSLGGFGDVAGTGVGVDYLAQRTAQPGTAGWTSHAITPPQQPLTFSAVGKAMDPLYLGSFSADLSRGIFRSWSPVPTADDPHSNVEEVENLYSRSDLRTPGTGAYQLLTNSAALLPPISGELQVPYLAGASGDLEQVLFESTLNLTADASGPNTKLYESDHGVVRLVRSGVTGCPGLTVASGYDPASMCAVAGFGASRSTVVPHPISSDGSRIVLTSPLALVNGFPGVNSKAGIASRLFQADDLGTAAAGEDATIQLNTSEQSAPDFTQASSFTQAASFGAAAADGDRVFFTSNEQLTNTAGSGLYMWERQPVEERQTLTVDATGGTFTLTARTQQTVGRGTLAAASTGVSSVNAGSFAVGQTVSVVGGTGSVPAGTRITAMNTFANAATTKFTLSAPATAGGSAQTLRASVDSTTAALPWDATAAQVQAALEALSGIGAGNVTVTGGPGGTAPFTITFTGGLSGVNVAQLSADASGLSGGAATATVATASDVHNLTLIGRTGSAVLGASEDGHRVYFVASTPLIGSETFSQRGLYLWQDADGTPGGSLAFVGGVTLSDVNANTPGISWNLTQLTSRVTPDGRSLLFEVTDGSELQPGYVHGSCTGNPNVVSNGRCSEAYVYSADDSTPLAPHVACASCDLAAPGASGNALLNTREGTGATSSGGNYNRAITDDGKRVFFNTVEALVPEDANGAIDAYEYDVPSGTVHLISGGTDPSDSYFMEASPDGDDVFFVTRQQLVGWDTDEAYDLYDARVGGGFPDPVPAAAACSGDACQGALGANPSDLRSASSGIRGAANGSAKRPCGKNRRRVTRSGKSRCVKKAHRGNKHKRANTNRRAGR